VPEGPGSQTRAVTDAAEQAGTPRVIEHLEDEGRPQDDAGGVIGPGSPVNLNDRRVQLTLFLMLLVALVSGATFLLMAYLPDSRMSTFREVLPVIFTPLVTLLGTSFGWFFATSDRENQRS